MKNASFVELRELSLTWNMPSRLAAMMHAKRALISVSGRNLYTLTRYTGLDPQSAWVGTGYSAEYARHDQAMTPLLTSLVTTISVTF
jgi:hypothetical protein